MDGLRAWGGVSFWMGEEMIMSLSCADAYFMGGGRYAEDEVGGRLSAM